MNTEFASQVRLVGVIVLSGSSDTPVIPGLSAARYLRDAPDTARGEHMN